MTTAKTILLVVGFIVCTLAITVGVGIATNLLWPSIIAWFVGLMLNLGFFVYLNKKEKSWLYSAQNFSVRK